MTIIISVADDWPDTTLVQPPDRIDTLRAALNESHTRLIKALTLAAGEADLAQRAMSELLDAIREQQS